MGDMSREGLRVPESAPLHPRNPALYLYLAHTLKTNTSCFPRRFALAQVAKPPPGLLPGLNVSVRGPSAGGRVAERSAALMREFKDGREGSHPEVGKKKRAAAAAEYEADTPQGRLAALKSMLGRPHVYGVADRAFK